MKTRFENEVNNIIGCLEYLTRDKENMDETSEAYAVACDAEKSIEFANNLLSIISGACVLATYAGEDWKDKQTAYGFGADSYKYCDKYIEGGIELADVYGTEDFYNDFSDYFIESIRPKGE